jgi:hypothetical protein
MKFIITESDLKSTIDKFLKLNHVEVTYLFFRVGYDNQKGRKYVQGTVYLYKKGEVYGARHGYEFFYDYNKFSKTLTYSGHYPMIERLDGLNNFPSDVIIEYFSENLKKVLEKGIINL